MREQKKMTRGDLERRMNNAVVLIPKTKDTKSIWFDDKGLRLTVTMDYAVFATITTNTIFKAIVPGGVSMPYFYIKRFLELALENDCEVKDENGNVTHSYVKLMANLKAKEDQTDFRIAWYCDLWFNNIMSPLYSIGESEMESFMVYEQYVHNIAKKRAIFEAQEKDGDVTNKEFVESIAEHLKGFIGDMDDKVLFAKKSEEEQKQDEADAMAQLNNEINGKEVEDKQE